ncbi:hypothetical protein EWM64_g3599 [Hericium alpestre]|uniref:Uncharacterized protein n=1 Tax=Hericium alpestre TaxID=135208 RepID=A0A4Z0A3Z3_9AGAM|nr:hypothetical protein EWM64_g3599 [Hericium alpestre]
MVFLLVARKVVLSFSVVLAFAILVLSSLLIYADNVNRMLELPNGNATAALAVGASVIHMCTILPMLVLDLIKRRCILSTVLVEAIWLWVMWIMWLAWLSSGCYKVKFLEIFCFINWIQLMIYTNTLFTLAVIGHLRGQPIWMSSVRDAPILSSPLALTMPSEPQFKPGFSHSTTISNAINYTT